MTLSSRVVPVVLVADDSPDAREMTKLLLEIEGCFVIEATDGREAVETALLCKPDLILLDIEMPIMNGLEVAQQLRRIAVRHTPIIAVTASDDKRRAAIESGCNECIAKPLLHDGVKRILARYLQHSDVERLIA